MKAPIPFIILLLLAMAAPLAVKAQTNEAPSTGPVVMPASNSASDVDPNSATPVPNIQQVVPNSAAPTQMAPMAPPMNMGNMQPPAQSPVEIKDIRPPIDYANYMIWIIAAACAIVLAVLAYYWIKNRPARLAQHAYDQTLEKLAKIHELLQVDNPMPYAVEVSETVRQYLGRRFNNRATRRTTEEFLHQMENDSSTPLAAHHELLRHFLQSCDMVKFARYLPTQDELEDVHQRAVNFVTATQPPKPGQKNGATV